MDLAAPDDIDTIQLHCPTCPMCRSLMTPARIGPLLEISPDHDPCLFDCRTCGTAVVVKIRLRDERRLH
jgi:hypothetical protein